MNTFFTADTHFGHFNVIKFCDRPYTTVDEMDDALILNWNSVVDYDDIVFHLGDFTLLGFNEFKQYAAKLNGQIRIVPGGHDWRWLEKFKKNPKITFSKSGHMLEVLDPLVSLQYPELSDNKQHPQVIVLCHYAMRVWDRSHYNSWHLYGHSHGNLPSHGLSFDVGVDSVYNYAPFSLEDVQRVLSKDSKS